MDLFLTYFIIYGLEIQYQNQFPKSIYHKRYNLKQDKQSFGIFQRMAKL